jgi:RNA polymerase sigma-70 factor (ECF subfamily)
MEPTAALLERAKRGDEEAYRDLYGAYRPAVLRLARSFAQLDADEVEDVIQETFVRAFRALKGLQQTAAFERWLLAIARNRALTLDARKEQSRRSVEQLSGETPHQAPALPPAMALERESAVVRELVEEMADGPEKETVRLFYVDGALSAREIAERMGVGKSAITMRLERFRAKVKRELLRRVLAVQME